MGETFENAPGRVGDGYEVEVGDLGADDFREEVDPLVVLLGRVQLAVDIFKRERLDGRLQSLQEMTESACSVEAEIGEGAEGEGRSEGNLEKLVGVEIMSGGLGNKSVLVQYSVNLLAAAQPAPSSPLRLGSAKRLAFSGGLSSVPARILKATSPGILLRRLVTSS